MAAIARVIRWVCNLNFLFYSSLGGDIAQKLLYIRGLAPNFDCDCLAHSSISSLKGVFLRVIVKHSVQSEGLRQNAILRVLPLCFCRCRKDQLYFHAHQSRL